MAEELPGIGTPDPNSTQRWEYLVSGAHKADTGHRYILDIIGELPQLHASPTGARESTWNADHTSGLIMGTIVTQVPEAVAAFLQADVTQEHCLL